MKKQASKTMVLRRGSAVYRAAKFSQCRRRVEDHRFSRDVMRYGYLHHARMISLVNFKARLEAAQKKAKARAMDEAWAKLLADFNRGKRQQSQRGMA